MERLTKKDPDDGAYLLEESALAKADGGYAGPAAERLGRFEAFYDDLKVQQEKLAEELEGLRVAGKKNSVKFKELLVKKMTGSNMLVLMQTYGLE